jgi:phosphotransferase system HPr (HPr) family protein
MMKMKEAKAIIQNAQGIHCRPSAVIVKHVTGYDGKITVSSDRGIANLSSIMELMTLELYPGSEVTIRVDGPEEERVCQELVELFESHFDFPPQ